MKIVIITQDENFVIPINIQKIIDLDDVLVEEIIIVDSRGSLINRKILFLKGFGFYQFTKMAFLIFMNKFLDMFDKLTNYKIATYRRSISAVAKKNNIPLRVVLDPNLEDTLTRLKVLSPDLIVSYSAPCVFKLNLLCIARIGCINLHCSYLPQYAGLLPSFWVLFNGENETGVTVHYMDDLIDNGAILMQEAVQIDQGMSMYRLIRKTKTVGGQLIAKVITKLQHGSLPVIPNNSNDGSYYTWPSIEEMRKFRKNGGRLI